MVLKSIRICIIFFICFPFISSAQDTANFYISNQGQDYYPGTSPLLAKKTIAATAPLLKDLAAFKGGVHLALNSGSVFEENLITSYPVKVTTYTNKLGTNDFAILDGAKEFGKGWIKDTGKNYTYKQAIPYTGFSGYGINGIESYSYIYVFEIDRSLEETAPFSARKLLQFVTSEALVENTSGSFYSPLYITSNPRQMYIHTSDGSSPNNNKKYRYEVTVRDWAINSTYQPDNVFENLWVRGFGAGNGMLPGGNNSYYNKIIFGPGAGIHHIGIRSGIIDHSLFLPAAKNTNDFAVVFYDLEGLARHCTVKNSIFLDIRAPLYAHTSYGTNYGMIEMNNIVGFADSTQRDGFMFTSNTDSILLNNIYAEGYTCGYNYGSAKYSVISNSYFKDVNFGIAYSAKNPVKASVTNVLVKTAGSLYTSGIYTQTNTSLTLTNSIFNISNNNASNLQNAGSFVNNIAAINSYIHATGNIFVCNINSSGTLIAATTNTDQGAATSKDVWDNNVYILLSGDKIVWKTTNAATNKGKVVIDNFEEWQKQSGQDKHSLFFDLKNDPRGLQAIFQDPDHGNYDLANTTEGKQIGDLKAGMSEPITCFLKKPTYEEAADYIRNNKILSINICRDPCSQNIIRINHTFAVKTLNDHQIIAEWNIAEQQNISYYELQKSTGNSVFKRVSIIPVRNDSLYSVIDEATAGTPYQYRLLIIAQSGSICYSNPQAVKTFNNKPILIYPNPSSGRLWISMNGYLGQVNCTILNSSGQAVLYKQFFSLYAPQLLELNHQPKGIYFIKVETSAGIIVQKIIVE